MTNPTPASNNDQVKPVNAIHTLRSGKEVDNRVEQSKEDKEKGDAEKLILRRPMVEE